MSDKDLDPVSKDITRYEVISEFEKIRQKQRRLYAELMEAEVQLKEFREVSKILQDCNPGRRCYRLMSDLLIEDTVANTLPFTSTERVRVESRIGKLHDSIRICAENLSEIRRTYNIRISKGLKVDPTFNEDFV